MSLLVVGSIAFDSVETPFGKAETALGGSALYFSYAASYFTHLRLVGVVGRDFPMVALDEFKRRGVDCSGVEVADGDTFRWSGKYEGDMSVAQTIETKLNVFGNFQPKIPAGFRDSRFVFLANGAPTTQMAVLKQMDKPDFVVADTMNLWMRIAKPDLLNLLKNVSGLILNDEEARELSGQRNLIRAGREILKLGPRIVVVKKGEHGAFLFSEFVQFALPAYPTDDVKDPTGAGDSFAGGFMGSLAAAGKVTLSTLKRAMAYGTICASVNVEDFSFAAMRRTNREQVDRRFEEFLQFIQI
ncbi:MAG: sugar kinase [Planctomycetes bacterium]|nr:sugar kinase [Planctomycetota bacterium]